ncbi:hypothetical protein [Xylanibacter muris]|uniref:Lipoprotein n=1 Tax=Xylanibacter muris TaxID=2736290 RepID=A0ABX2AJC6_9BACT|nr:hypothetical protein [Xylanibacter muris]NPD91206.1 hypothetical protein [Xylanibacter muris]
MRIKNIFLLGCLIAASCTTPKAISNDKIKYDKTLPVIPKVSVIKDPANYNKEDKYTFPIYGNETAVAPPVVNRNGSLNPVAIWCTKECTVVASLTQLQWDMHYFQRTSGDYIEDAETGKRYYVKGTYDGLPMDMSYNIKGVSGEWICSFDIYPPLPEKCTRINIIEQDVTDNVKNGAAWGGGLRIHNVQVSLLQRNQNIVKFQKTRIIE